jgi:hypothetical protein
VNKRVPGDLGQSSSIELVEEHQENLRMLKQECREHEQTWNKLATARALSRWRKIDLGRKRHWRAMVANRRQERVLWLRDHLMELAACVGDLFSSASAWKEMKIQV